MNDKQNNAEEKVSISLPLPIPIYDKIKLDAILTKKSVGAMVAEWIEDHADPDGLSLDVETLMAPAPVREKTYIGVPTKALTIPLSRRHAAMLRLEAMRSQTPVRSMLRKMIQQNARAWSVMPIDEAV